MDQFNMFFAPLRFQLRLMDAYTALFMQGARSFREMYGALPDPWTFAASRARRDD